MSCRNTRSASPQPSTYSHSSLAQVVGIGSGMSPFYLILSPIHQLVSLGSTVPYVVERIIAQGSVNTNRVFIPTGAYRAAMRPIHNSSAARSQAFNPRNSSLKQALRWVMLINTL